LLNHGGAEVKPQSRFEIQAGKPISVPAANLKNIPARLNGEAQKVYQFIIIISVPGNPAGPAGSQTIIKLPGVLFPFGIEAIQCLNFHQFLLHPVISPD